MKTLFATVMTLCLLATGSFAATTMLDDFEDTNYATAAGTGESITLSSSTDHSQGSNSLEVTYTYTAQDAWYKNATIEKTLATPVDISQLEFFQYDISVPTANSNFMMSINFIDDLGYQARFENYAAFTSATTGFETHTFSLSGLHKNQWVSAGRAANLKKIAKITFHLMNGGAVSAGTLQFKMDNAKFIDQVNSVREVVVEDFESYTDTAALASAWQPSFGGATPSLETTNPYAGAGALRLTENIAGAWTNYGAAIVFSATQNFSNFSYFKMAVYGDAQLDGLSPTAHIYLEDGDGNRVLVYIWNWPAQEEWSEIFMPVQTDGIESILDATGNLQWGGNSCWRQDRWDAGGWDGDCDLSQIVKMHVSIEIQSAGSPSDVNLLFDNISVGYTTNGFPESSAKQYNVAKTSTSPTIDGQVGTDEWYDAGSRTCSGFVQHDNNTVAAGEDPQVKAMYDETNLYILYQVVNADFSLDVDPTGQTRDPSSIGFGGDDFEIFLAPGSNMGVDYYHTVFFPDEAESYCYIWDEFGSGDGSSGWPGQGATSWDGTGDQAAFTYDSGSSLLTIEYRIPWTAFNVWPSVITEMPEAGTVWGVQLGYINNNPLEAVNWEPDATAGFVQGRPFGTWVFTGTTQVVTGTENWEDYR